MIDTIHTVRLALSCRWLHLLLLLFFLMLEGSISVVLGTILLARLGSCMNVVASLSCNVCWEGDKVITFALNKSPFCATLDLTGLCSSSSYKWTDDLHDVMWPRKRSDMFCKYICIITNLRRPLHSSEGMLGNKNADRICTCKVSWFSA